MTPDARQWDPDHPATAFVVGPGRSGTTLLYKLLCLHPEVAYVSNLEHRLGWLPLTLTSQMRLRDYPSKLRYWFEAEGNAYFVNRPLHRRAVPVPVEGEPLYARCGIPLFPGPGYRPSAAAAQALRGAFATLCRGSGARVMVSKRTANNRRLPALSEIFPEGRFVNLLRDGREVAASLSRVEWWHGHQLWWDPDKRTPAQAVADGEHMLRLCARNWVAETEAIRRGLAGVAPQRVLDVRYEALLEQPEAEMSRILEHLGLAATPAYREALASLNLNYRPGNWRERWSPREIDMVNAEQAQELTRLGYAW